MSLSEEIAELIKERLNDKIKKLCKEIAKRNDLDPKEVMKVYREFNFSETRKRDDRLLHKIMNMNEDIKEETERRKFDDVFQELINSNDKTSDHEIIFNLLVLREIGQTLSLAKIGDSLVKYREKVEIDEDIEYESMFTRRRKEIYRMWYYLIKSTDLKDKTPNKLKLKRMICIYKDYCKDEKIEHLIDGFYLR